MEEKKEKSVLYYCKTKEGLQYAWAYSPKQAAMLIANRIKKYVNPKDIFVHISSIYVVFKRKQDYIDRAGIKHTVFYDVTDDPGYYCPGCINRAEYNNEGYYVEVKNEDVRKAISDSLSLIKEYIPVKYRKYIFAEYNNKRYFK